ncbi:MAG: ABC transporter permease subunit [Nitrospina sp.]|nr:MAG: ABC transporter permease subunit [Nitrospina sp.]TDJ59825.1 MAG: ABC transporter permease subunit [Nitrospina sp.]
MKLSQDLQIKFQKFKSDKRARYSLMALMIAFFLTLPAELLYNVRPIILVVDSKPYFPILFTYSEQDFGGPLISEPDYKSQRFLRILKGEPPDESAGLNLSDFEEDGAGLSLGLGDFDEGEDETSGSPLVLTLDDFEEDDSVLPLPEPEKATLPESPGSALQARDYWMIWPPVRYDYKYIPSHATTGRVVLAAPYETLSFDGSKTIPSSWQDGHYLGTDDRGRDVLARLVYGFRISMIFGLSLAVTGTLLGCLLGGIQGFFGGLIDLIGQRLTEMWGSIPRLYILIILSAMLAPSALLLFAILNLTAWMGMAAYIRAEFLRGRNLEYVKAAKALGVSNFRIMGKHILPNSLTPVITFFPFEVTAGILALVSLDFLNLGVPSPAPSLGELLAQGKSNLQAIWILLPTFAVLTGALTLLTFVGDGIRNAFDPRKAEN